MREPEVTYDHDAQALYVEIADGTVVRTIHVYDNVNLDLDADGRVLGIEVLG